MEKPSRLVMIIALVLVLILIVILISGIFKSNASMGPISQERINSALINVTSSACAQIDNSSICYCGLFDPRNIESYGLVKNVSAFSPNYSAVYNISSLNEGNYKINVQAVISLGRNDQPYPLFFNFVLNRNGTVSNEDFSDISKLESGTFPLCSLS